MAGQQSGVPSAPRNLTATAISQSQIRVDWTEPADSGSSAITHYHIQVSFDGNDFFTLLAIEAPTTTFTDSGIETGGTRWFRVLAENSAGLGPPSNADSATTFGGEDQPSAPRNVRATADGDSAIDLSWDEPEQTGGSEIVEYEIEVSNDGGQRWSVLAYTPGTTNYRDSGLSPGTTRHYRVRAGNADDAFGPFSAVFSATTLGGGDQPSAPRSVRATADGDSAIDLSWDEPEETGGSEIVEYEIEVSNDGGQRWSVLAYTGGTSYRDSGLSPGTTRHYRVRAGNVDDVFGPFSAVVSATTEGQGGGDQPPSAPRNLTATSSGDSAIDLSWTPPASPGSSAINTYRVEFSGDGGANWSSLATATATTTSIRDGGLAPGTTRYYRVFASNNVGDGPPSNVAFATTEGETDDALPGPPRNLRAQTDGETVIELTWSPPLNSGTSPIIAYRIEISRNGGTTWSVLVGSTGSTTTRYRHSGLQPGTTRHYRVSALNAAGRGPTSNVAFATTSSGTATGEPGPPRNLRATATGQTTIDLSWNTPLSNGNSPIVGYRIEVSRNGGSTWRNLAGNTGSTATRYTHTGLQPGETRHYRVSAINSHGTGLPSNVSYATTGDGTTLGAPQNVVATAIGTSRIDLSWVEPADDGGSAVTGYRIRVSMEGDPDWTVLVHNTGSTATTFAHSNLEPATTWHYRLQAINANGAGLESNVASATTEADLPGAPSDLVAVARSHAWIELSWDAPAYTGGASIMGYRIEVYEEDGSLWKILAVNTRSTTTSYHHLGLEPGTTHFYRVRAINRVGAGPPSIIADATTHAVPPGAPVRLRAVAAGASRINLAWEAPTVDGGAPVNGYRIEVFRDGDTQWRVLVPNTRSTTTEYVHTGLDPATTWYYRVAAINAAGAGTLSNQAGATTDAIVPDAPTELTATAIGSSKIELSWRGPNFNGGAAITGYRIEVSENGGASWTPLVANTGSTSTIFPHTGLRPASTRHYRVSAINREGIGGTSNVAGATTEATEPSAPTALAAAAQDHQQISLAWETPEFDGGARIAGYRVEVSENGTGGWLVLSATTGSTNTAYLHNGLSPATTRYYRVSAINEIGASPPSNVAHATTDAIAADPPTNLVATAVAPTQIDLLWTGPSYDGGAPVTSYRIEISEEGTEWSDLVPSTATTETSYSHTHLQPGSTRYYRVSAINVVGPGLPSEVAFATTDDPVERAGRVTRAVLSRFASAMTTSTLEAISRRIEAVAGGSRIGWSGGGAGRSPLADVPALRGLAPDPTMAQLLDGASFVVPVGPGLADQQVQSGLALATWGGAEYLRMGEPGGEEVQWSGDMLSLHLGTDARIHRNVLVGVAATRSTGSYDFTDLTYGREVAGSYEVGTATVNPYLAWLPGQRGMAVWVSGGVGWGEMAVEDDLAGKRTSPVRTTTGALGLSRMLLSNGLNSLSARAEGWLSRVRTDEAEGVDSLSFGTRRARVALEWSQANRFEGGHEVNLLLQGGVRYDANDVSDWVGGMEVGGGLRYTSPRGRLTLEGRGRLLATSEYEEWGASGLVQVGTQDRQRGLSLKLAPAWGESASGVHELWERGAEDGLDGSRVTQQGRLNTEVAYAIPSFAGAPYARFHLVKEGPRSFGAGVRYQLGLALDLYVEGTRSEGIAVPARHGLAARGAWRF